MTDLAEIETIETAKKTEAIRATAIKVVEDIMIDTADLETAIGAMIDTLVAILKNPTNTIIADKSLTKLISK